MSSNLPGYLNKKRQINGMESINQQLFKSILPAAFKDTKRLKSVDG
jgi:hypothetical protein